MSEVQQQNARQANCIEFPSKGNCLHHLIEKQVERTPENIAAVFEGESVTYRELNARANQLAHYLQKRGVGPDVLVAVLMERSMRMMVSLLAILKAGGAYVPLDSHFPEERLKYMFEDSKPKIVLTEKELDQVWKKLRLDTEAFYVDRDWAVAARESVQNPSTGVQPKNLAYVIYTSGSTGQPKGVELTHASVVNFMESMKREPGIQEKDTLLAVTTISFDIAALELFLPLTVGARMVLASRNVPRVAQPLARAIEENSVTIMQAAPTTWRLLVESGWKGKKDLKVLCGGEAFPRDLANQLVALTSEVWNMYGPTETTIWSTIQKVKAGSEPVPIGRPIANTQVYILDSDLNQLPAGEIGELFIGGDGLARGYLNRAETTAERFIRNPIAGEPSARIYRTGDLARVLPSGEIEYQGRVDHQIKIHGVRVEPGEIETAIMQFPGVQQALVIAREDKPGDKRLVAYLILADSRNLQTSGLRDFLRKKLPDYLIPSAFIPLASFPITFNGKIDRKALPVPPAPVSVTVTVSEGPRDDIEYRLVTIWESILKVKPIGLRDNFFDLGGHSLMAARLMARIDQSLGKELAVESLLEAPTIEQQAQLIRGNNGATARSTQSKRAGEIPLFYLGGDPTFQPLSQRLRELHPFHSLGIQASIVRQLKNPYSLPEMAGHFVKAIRERHPEGPYMLGGWCAHGVLALETAQQLRRQGQEVALLILLESINPERLRQQPRLTRTIARWQVKLNLLEFEYTYLRTLGREQARDYVSGRLARKFTVLHSNIRENLRKSQPDETRISRMTPLAVLYSAAANYVPVPYDSPVLLMRSSRSVFGFASDPHLGWGNTLGEKLEVCETPGNHYTMYVEPNVDGLVQRVSPRVKAAQQRWQNRQLRQTA